MTQDYIKGAMAAGQSMFDEHLRWAKANMAEVTGLEPIVNAQLATLVNVEELLMNPAVAGTLKLAWMMGYWWAQRERIEKP